MDDFDSIFNPPSDTDADTDLANASAMLNKIAADVGVDLNKLSEETIAELLGDLMPAPTHTDTPRAKEAQMTTPQSPTVADVSLELSKIAAADGIDMTKVSKEEYAEAFDSLAARMASPDYHETKIAAEEEQAKLAEAYHQGARMADGFLDRLKQAEEEEKKDKEKDKEKDEKEKEASRYSEAANNLKNVAKSHLNELKGHAQEKGKALLGAVKDHGMKHKDKYTHGAAGAAGAAAGGAAGHMAGSRKKEAQELDELVTKIAAKFLADAGFNPDTGEKTAAEANIDDLFLSALALQKIAEAGYFGPTE